MINLQFKTNSLKSVHPFNQYHWIMDEIEQKGQMLDQEKITRVDLFVKRGKKYMHCQSEILSSHGNLDWNLKENKNKLIKTNQCQDNVALVRCEIQSYAKMHSL